MSMLGGWSVSLGSSHLHSQTEGSTHQLCLLDRKETVSRVGRSRAMSSSVMWKQKLLGP